MISSPVVTRVPDDGWFLVRRGNLSLWCDRARGSQLVPGRVAIHPLECRREYLVGQAVAASQRQAGQQLLQGLVAASNTE